MVLYSMLLSALSQGLLYAPMALGVYITFRILQTPDLTVDGSFVFGMTVSAVVTIAGHPVLALVCGALAGALAGFFTALLQTKLKVEPILSGILVSTGLYTVNYAVLGGQSNLYLQSQVKNASGAMVNASSSTIYRLFGALPVCGQGFLKETNAQVLVLTLCIVTLLVAALSVFFFTRPGMAIRATGDNEEMVRSSSINADLTRTAGVMLANALVSLSGALLCQQQRYADLNCGNGMLVMGLASVIIGQALTGQRGVVCGLISAAGGSLIYRVVLQLAYKVNMPSYVVKLLSALIVVLALSMPLIQKKLASLRKGGARP
ncbi:MAG: ABC transporter permease [Candidatus Ventricola sp.]